MSNLPTDFAVAVAVTGGSMWLAWVLAGFMPHYAKGRRLPASEVTLRHRADCSDRLVTPPFMGVVAYLAFRGTMELWTPGAAGVEDRWFGATWATKWFQLLYVARMMLHLPFQTYLLYKDKKVLLVQMTFHHVLSALCYGGGLVTGRMHWYAAADGLCEVTSVFLDMLMTIKFHTDPNGAVHQVLGPVVGFGLWLTFLIFRLCLFPAWLYMFYQDVNEFPAQTWAKVTFVERYVYAFTTAMLLLLSSIWMVQINAGLMKALDICQKKEKKKD